MTSICNPNKENLSIVSYVLRLDKPVKILWLEVAQIHHAGKTNEVEEPWYNGTPLIDSLFFWKNKKMLHVKQIN
jgi:hypothetical protein